MNIHRPARTAALGVAALMAASTALSACGSDSSSGPPTLKWYINPDVGNADASKGGQATLAKECSEASGGRYRIDVQLLPNSASDQRTQLLRRLAAGDSSMDLMSIDPAFVTEFAAAGYLAPVPKDLESQFTADRVQSSVDASTYKGKLIAVPFWSNTQVLWYKKSAARKAGLDMTKPVTSDQLVDATKRSGTQLGVQAKLYEGYSVWINALVAGAGGKIVRNPDATYEDIELGLDSDAGRKAAAVIHKVATSGIAGPAMGSSTETESLALFDSKAGGFLVNWPYTYGALTATDKKDVGAAMYPRTDAGTPAKPPYGGIQLGVGSKSAHPDLAYQAAACITDQKHTTDYMVKSGNPSSRKKSFDDPAVRDAFPGGIAALVRSSLDNAEPRPLSPYWGDISTALQQRFSPPDKVTEQTPATTQKFILDVLDGKALL